MNGSQFFPNGFQGRHMLMFLSVFFGVMFIVNGIFLYFAISTFSGLSTGDAYRKGLAYNQRIANEHVQNELGWKSSVKMEPNGSYLTIQISRRNGEPVRNLNIHARLMRPVSDRFDISLMVKEETGGTYHAGLENIDPGNWVLDIRALQPGDTENHAVYRMKKRLWLKQSK